jgi:Protein of unknown function (DUF2635)
MPNLFLKPALDAAGKALLVRDPMTLKPLAAAGEWKAQAQYWIRRLRDKEVVETTPPVAAAPTPAAPAVPPVAPAAPIAPGVPVAPAAPPVASAPVEAPPAAPVAPVVSATPVPPIQTKA